MTTCLDINTCPTNKLYDIRCNFITNYLGINYEYTCNPHTTCMRANKKYDCCGNHIVDCIVYVSSLHEPTIQPSVVPIVAMNKTICNKMCSKIDKCYWYEKLQTDNLCVENNNVYCCSHNRKDCCRTNKTDTYIIVFGSIACIMIIFTYYMYYIKKKYHKITPTQEV